MKNLFTIIFVGYLLLLVLSCGKRNKNHKSVLYINGTAYETKDFQAYIMNGQPQVTYTGTINDLYIGFSINFNTSLFPTRDSFHVSYGGINQNQCNIGMIHREKQYLVDRHNQTYLKAYVMPDGISRYELPETWFYDQYPDTATGGFLRGDDSVLISGTFYEPYEIIVK